MVFSSPIFLFLFLPLFLILYYLIIFPSKNIKNRLISRCFLGLSNLFVLVSSLLFYFWGEGWLIFVMLTSTVVDYLCGMLLGLCEKRQFRKALLAISICSNLCLLGFFKYFNFGLDTINALAGSMGFAGWHADGALKIALPLGISFYTFQSMSYTIDVYRREVEPTRNFFSFACFVSMFPQLVAGPIVRYRDVATELFDRKVSLDNISAGCLRFVFGLSKKVLIANTVALPADKIFAIPSSDLTPSLAWFGIVCYAMQIYFDFSGYSDMAIGLGRMLGFTFPENFNYPYISKSVQEFWRRWHMSLSTWFRDYLYIPLGGNRVAPWRVYFNLFFVFFLCGLWHGASWNFILWGLFHGLFLVLERSGILRFVEKLPALLRHIYVLLMVLIGWVLFRTETLEQAWSFLTSMFGYTAGTHQVYQLSMYASNDVVFTLIVGLVLSCPLYGFLSVQLKKMHARIVGRKRRFYVFLHAFSKASITLIFMLLSIMSISSGSYNPFIYFRF